MELVFGSSSSPNRALIRSRAEAMASSAQRAIALSIVIRARVPSPFLWRKKNTPSRSSVRSRMTASPAGAAPRPSTGNSPISMFSKALLFSP